MGPGAWLRLTAFELFTRLSPGRRSGGEGGPDPAETQPGGKGLRITRRFRDLLRRRWFKPRR